MWWAFSYFLSPWWEPLWHRFPVVGNALAILGGWQGFVSRFYVTFFLSLAGLRGASIRSSIALQSKPCRLVGH